MMGLIHTKPWLQNPGALPNTPRRPGCGCPIAGAAARVPMQAKRDVLDLFHRDGGWMMLHLVYMMYEWKMMWNICNISGYLSGFLHLYWFT